MGLANQTPHCDEWGARSEWKKTRTMPYRIILHFLYESAIRGGSGLEIRNILADRHPNRCRTKVLPHHYISMPYGPNLTNKFAIPHVCLYHVYVPTVHSSPNELYNIHGDTHATIKVTVQSEHEPYQSNGDTFDTNPLRIIQTTLRTLQYRPYKTYC